MFDLLASADLLVDDAGVAARQLQRVLGVLPARGDFLQLWPRWGFEAHWCRVAPRLSYAPTHVEVIAPYGEPDPSVNHPRIAEIHRCQQPRRYKTHSTPVAVRDLDVVLARLDSRGAPYRLDEPEGELPFRRLWLGRSATEPGHYDPAADGGLYLEFIATADMGFPIRTEAVAPDLDAGDGLIRVAARVLVVSDLRDTLDKVRDNIGWEPDEIIEGADEQRAVFGFTHVHSATLEVIQPTAAGSAAHDYLGAWGPGPYGMRLEVRDLQTSAERLDAAGVRYRDRRSDGVPALLPDPAELFGVAFELIEVAQ